MGKPLWKPLPTIERHRLAQVQLAAPWSAAFWKRATRALQSDHS